MEVVSTWEQRTAACFHESGHAVVAHRLGVPVTFASVDDVDGSGAVNTPRPVSRYYETLATDDLIRAFCARTVRNRSRR